ncbi:kinesin family protein-like protein [Phyllosticta citricarpa]|uniref:Kinesin family protein-like protein n=2 Tax=Phyllosticta TaxID=121621 RepID=A0ABR1LK06_9PEZI
MAASPPGSPAPSAIQRPMSALLRPNRSSSRMSMSSRPGGSRASDEDSKTAVKVAIRVRPPLKPGDPNYELIPQRFRGSVCQTSSDTTIAVDSNQGKKLFVFDRVFSEDIGQSGVWEYLNDSINSFVQGYNVSILAYGQSGAGKSYTMGTSGPGQQADPNAMGVVPRAAKALFEMLIGSSTPSAGPGTGLRAPTRYPTVGLPPAKSGDKNWQLKATYVEIHNETLRDLLIPAETPPNERAQVTIREDTKGRIILTGLQQLNINSIDDLLHALNYGSSIRQTDSTAINSQSSRSHAVFSLNLVQKKSKPPAPITAQEKRRSVPIEAMTGSEGFVTVDSKMHFVDLAGSERLKNSGAQGERAKEGISINAGLAALGKVISQLSSRSGAHVSYRDSKLTRLLQDSLGGNAITYMVACVNPAEFHISETLNTVQYAQRARAIQSKPKIQQTSEDGDKQAIIDRLRAEVSFLRDQIRLSERTDRKSKSAQERAERNTEREMELQNQLLDLQENYTALSQRHANFISEITKAHPESDAAELTDALGETAMERLKRSNSFAEAVQAVVLEYEKTIQSLESSLSTTRTHLSTSESSLLEKETKIAYMESVNQQLQSRIQKFVDREANNESYLHDLEAKVDGITSGEEKQTAIIQDLRKELNRARETELSAEEYITTLEDRLAEAEQDHELMHREIERLEHVIERQRSIGKLDNLLYELDNIQKENKNGESESATNGEKALSDVFEEPRAEDVDEERSPTPRANGDTIDEVVKDDIQKTEVVAPSTGDDMPQSPEQSRFVADKLESVTQELLDLRMEHETTVHDHEELQRKYQATLRTLSELQDAVDEARANKRDSSSTRPDSFLADAGVNGVRETKEDGQPSSSRTLSSELSLLGESTNPRDSFSTAATSEADTAHQRGRDSDGDRAPHDEERLVHEIEKLKRLHDEKEESMGELTSRYAQLEKDHQETLKYVEELKVEMQRAAQLARPDSPTAHVIRRKLSQNIVAVDRANRSFAAIRNIGLDHLEEEPEITQAFEQHLNTIMVDLHTAKERVNALEADLAQSRKEMEGKMSIISGLTRERSSLKGSPLDISVVAQMREQLMENENMVKQLQETHATRENELLEQIESLRNALCAPRSPSVRITDADSQVSQSPGRGGSLLEPPSPETKAIDDHSLNGAQEEQISSLQREVAQWQTKYQSTMDSMRASEQELQATIKQLESALRAAEEDQAERAERAELSDAQAADVEALREEIKHHKATAAASASRLESLEESYSRIIRQVDEDTKARDLTDRELQTHRGLVSNLERQLEQHKATVDLHQQGLDSLRDTHAKEIQESSQRIVELGEELERAQREEHEAKAAVAALVANISAALNEETDATKVQSQIEALTSERKDLREKYLAATTELDSVKTQLEQVQAQAAASEDKVSELKMINDELLKEIEVISEREKKSARLVDELEEQLNSNYDQQQMATNRLSALQTERQFQLEEALQAKTQLEHELEDSRRKISDLESQLGSAKRTSHRESLDPRDASQNRKSSHNSLPSPPPAIPLPPLPGSPPSAGMSSPGPTPSSPPGSRHQSKDIAQAQFVEDQEARIRTIEKHLFAEKQLTATLEEALTDLESNSTKVKGEMETWKRKCHGLEEELNVLRQEQSKNRYSLQAVEEERNARMRVEAERAHLEARMAALNQSNKKKKKSALNCF